MVGTPNLVPYYLAPGSLCITTISLVDLPVKYRYRDRMSDSLQVMGLCTWVSGRWACVCTWTGMYGPGQVCVYLGRHVCVPGKACVYMDRYVYSRAGCVCAAYTVAVTKRSSQEGHTQQSQCCSLLWHCPSSPTSGEGVPPGTCTPGAQPFSPGWETVCRTWHSLGWAAAWVHSPAVLIQAT